LDAQTEKIRTMARLQDVEVADVILDSESAKTLTRPGMAWLLAQVAAGAVRMVIVAKLDRLTRSVKDLGYLLEQFARHDVALVSVAEALDTGSAHGRLILNILVSVGQWEREAISERTREALQHKKAKGERVGTLPYGLRLITGDPKHMEPAPIEQRIQATMRELRAHMQTFRQIAAELNSRGFTTRRGTPWRREYVARQLRKVAG